MGRDYDPVPGQWYQDLDEEALFLVLSIDPDAEIVEIQYEDGEIEQLDLDTWHELDLNKAEQPEGWAGSVAADEDDEDWEEEEEDEDDDDWDEDDEDDLDDDDDDDYDDRDQQ